MTAGSLLKANREYWNREIHDFKITNAQVGTPEFFKQLETYRYEKLAYLPGLVNFSGYSSRRVLEIGCGVGIDSAHFARGGAFVTGVDFSPASIELARKHFAQENLPGDFLVMDGEELEFPDNCFDLVYAFGVLQYTVDPRKMISEIHRVMKIGGEGILMVYNRYSWMNFLSKLMKVKFENQDAPVFRKYSLSEYKDLLKLFSHKEIIPERFPVITRLHHGLKAFLFNHIFIRAFNVLPRQLVRQSGWHLLAFVKK